MTEHKITNSPTLICSRCEKDTENNNQGHYWAYCTVTKSDREFHFCCPDNCELEVENG